MTKTADITRFYKQATVFSILSIFFVFTFYCDLLFATTSIKGKVVGVSDGDTITVLMNKTQYKIRLYGIDCPESGQEFGKKAKEFTSSLVFGKTVDVTVYDIDKYKRSVGVVSVDGVNVNEALLRSGYAWVYTKYCDQAFCDTWRYLEEQSRGNRTGLWRDKNPVPPWDWRKNQRQGYQQSDQSRHVLNDSAGMYHGNIKSHVFHSSNCRHYNCKNCTQDFRTREEAIAAGFRGHEQCIGN